MLEYIHNPSAAISKRLFRLGCFSEYRAEWDHDIRTMNIVRKCLRHIHDTPKTDFLFHGFAGIEASIKLLSEFGIDEQDPHFEKCVDMLLDTPIDDAFYEKGISKIGRILEQKGHSGSKTIRAASLVLANASYQSLVKDEIAHALECFKAVQTYETIEDFAYRKKDRWVYREGCLFPDYYNLRLLAFSTGWRSEENRKVLRKALRTLIKLQPLPHVYILEKGQLIAPGSYLMHEFDNDFADCTDDRKAEWLLRNEYLARMGMADVLHITAQCLADEDSLIDSAKKIAKSYSFKTWGSYSGVSLEENWRKEERKVNDIAFRVGLIQYYKNENGIAQHSS